MNANCFICMPEYIRVVVKFPYIPTMEQDRGKTLGESNAEEKSTEEVYFIIVPSIKVKQCHFS